MGPSNPGGVLLYLEVEEPKKLEKKKQTKIN